MNVLFLCTGNYSRSPAAAAILNSYGIQGLQADSAGLTDWGIGRFINPLLQRALQEVTGIELVTHIPKLVNRDMVTWADRIYVMESGHIEELTSMFPGFVHKINLLAEIPNPSHENYAELCEAIKQIINCLSAKWQGG